MSESSSDLKILERAERLSEDVDRLEEAIGFCDDVLSRTFDSAAAQNLKGFCLAKLGRHGEAISSFKLARLYLPNLPLIRFNLARALEACGELAAAEEEYGETLKLDSSDNAARRCRGGVRLQRGDLSRALEDLAEAVGREPEAADGYVLRGACFMAMGRIEEAREEFARALMLEPDQKERVEAIIASMPPQAGDGKAPKS